MEDREVDLLTMPLQILPYIFQKIFSICFVNVRNESGPEHFVYPFSSFKLLYLFRFASFCFCINSNKFR